MPGRLALLLLLLAGASAAAPPAAATEGSEFAAIDAHALLAPSSATSSVSALAAYLAAPARDDREKARAIFRWITNNVAYDFALWRESADPEAVLKRRRAVCSGYSALFKALAQAAGLQAEVVYGLSKGIGFEGGEGPAGSPSHAWNAVKIAGEWRLLDCTWGAGSLEARRGFVPRFRGHYFLTPPEIFLDDHFPEEPRWQLLDPPIPREEYFRRVQRRPAFFEHGLRLVSHPGARIEADGSLSVVIGAPERTIVTARLCEPGRELEEQYTFTQREPGGFLIRVLFPQKGDYLLRIFAADKSLPGDALDWALEYAITARSGKGGRKFPETYASFLTRDCHLETPLSQALPADTSVEFSLTVPGAQDVLVAINEAVSRLAARGGGRFSGAVPVGRGEVTVFAKFPDNARYEGLLEYVGR
jgi:hypothetical protein